MRLCDLVTYGDSLETVIHNLEVSIWEESSRKNGYTTEYGNSYKQLLEWLKELKELKEKEETAKMKQQSALLNQLCERDKELIRKLYEALKDLESDVAEDVRVSDYYDQVMRNIIELVTELKDKTEGETR